MDPSPASHAWMVDTVDPSGTVEINGGEDFTNDAAVNLTLSADDPSPGSGVTEMSFSNDGTTWSIPEPFATSKSWDLSSGDGEKTVHVQYKDAAGNDASAQDTIELDTAAPSVETWLPKGKKVSPRAKPTVTFSEAMDEASVEASNAGKPTTFILKKGSKVLPSTVSYTESGTTFKAVLTPKKPLKRGTKYTATVTTAATDAAGNELGQDPSAAAGVAKTWKFTVKQQRSG